MITAKVSMAVSVRIPGVGGESSGTVIGAWAFGAQVAIVDHGVEGSKPRKRVQLCGRGRPHRAQAEPAPERLVAVEECRCGNPCKCGSPPGVGQRAASGSARGAAAASLRRARSMFRRRWGVGHAVPLLDEPAIRRSLIAGQHLQLPSSAGLGPSGGRSARQAEVSTTARLRRLARLRCQLLAASISSVMPSSHGLTG